jgi:hypothetical protein
VRKEAHGLAERDGGDDVEGQELIQPSQVDRTELAVLLRGVSRRDEAEKLNQLVINALFEMQVFFAGVLNAGLSDGGQITRE